MKLKNNFFYTLRENVKNEDSVSGNLLVRSGMIKKSSSGIYMFMPIGLIVLKKIENIVRKEMNNSGATEVLMPSLVHEEVYEKSGRTALFGDSVFKLKDRYQKPYVLGPTHEELFVIAGSSKIKSYKDMPFNIYQIQNKYRDEARARYGLIRVREFLMKDAYSFDINDENVNVAYDKMKKAYINAFNEMGLNYKIVKADTGVMGGLLSEEFQAISPIGEDTVVYCENCGYSSNLEICECVNDNYNISNKKGIYKEIETINCKTIKEVSNCLDVEENRFVKSLMYKVDDNLVLALVRGDREINETKLLKILDGKKIELSSFEEVNSISSVGFIGPVNLKIKTIIDKEVANMENFITGANKENYHLIDVNINDIDAYEIEDIRNVTEDDKCPKCGNKLKFDKGIEIGNIFKLGTKYSKCFNLNYLDENNKLNPVHMGCYGIGIGRCMAAVVEQNNDENGINWPVNIAPFKVAIIPTNNDEEILSYANELYTKLIVNVECILDDRNERTGVKFKDMDLIGIPYKIIIGKHLKDGFVEFKKRNDFESVLISTNEIIEKINNL